VTIKSTGRHRRPLPNDVMLLVGVAAFTATTALIELVRWAT
jgi:hypothetical protein